MALARFVPDAVGSSQGKHDNEWKQRFHKSIVAHLTGIGNPTMASVLLLTNTLGASAEVLPALGLLQHSVKILPAEASVLVDVPEMQVLLIDARRDLPAAKSLTKLLTTTGVGAPVMAITTEGGLSAISAEWGIDDVMLDTAGPAEVDARIRLAIGTYQSLMNASDPSAGEIRTGEVVIDENSYTARIKGRALDLTFKEFELLKYLAQHPGRVFTRSQLLQEIWGYDYFGGTRTVDVHIRRLRSKLGPEFEAIIGTVRNVGYRFTLPHSGKDSNISERV
jgi:DNA-binding response OmpR family regulator